MHADLAKASSQSPAATCPHLDDLAGNVEQARLVRPLVAQLDLVGDGGKHGGQVRAARPKLHGGSEKTSRSQNSSHYRDRCQVRKRATGGNVRCFRLWLWKSLTRSSHSVTLESSRAEHRSASPEFAGAQILRRTPYAHGIFRVLGKKSVSEIREETHASKRSYKECPGLGLSSKKAVHIY